MNPFRTAKVRRSGPSVFEVFFVLAIIATASVVAFSFLNKSVASTTGVTRVAQVKELQKSLEYYYSENGHYPVTAKAPTGSTCFGSFAEHSCWKDGTGIKERPELAAVLVPKYLQSWPKGETTRFGNSGDTYYSGMVYTYVRGGSSYIIQYFIEGDDSSCIIENAVKRNIAGDTLCAIFVEP